MKVRVTDGLTVWMLELVNFASGIIRTGKSDARYMRDLRVVIKRKINKKKNLSNWFYTWKNTAWSVEEKGGMICRTDFVTREVTLPRVLTPNVDRSDRLFVDDDDFKIIHCNDLCSKGFLRD